jgi:glycosyltransferase involved in cell wall biosynthesis
MLDRNELHRTLQTFDVALIPLKNRIYGSVPSKIFEYGALGFPVLYFGGGEGETIVEENKLGWIADVGNYNELNATLQLISKMDKSELVLMKKRIFETSIEAFNLDRQMSFLLENDVF